MENVEIWEDSVLIRCWKRRLVGSTFSSIWNSENDNEENVRRKIGDIFAGLNSFFTRIGRHAVTNRHTWAYRHLSFEIRKDFRQVIEIDRRVKGNFSCIKNRDWNVSN